MKKSYDPTRYHFKVGEEIWLLREHWINDQAITKAVVTSIYDEPNKKDPANGFIFYSVTPLDITLWDKMKCWMRSILITINPQWPIPLPWKYPGHCLLPGENLFRTRTEAEQELNEET